MSIQLDSELPPVSLSFDEMTQSERAVAVAMDVIATIQAENNIRITRGHYFHFRRKIGNKSLGEITPETELQGLLPEIERQGCNVCARGAAFLSRVRLFDNYKAKNVLNWDGTLGLAAWEHTEEALSDTFSLNTRNLIECAFEGELIHRQDTDIGFARGAVVFGDRFKADDERLIAIMENVIANGGEFVVDHLDRFEFVGLGFEEPEEDDEDWDECDWC